MTVFVYRDGVAVNKKTGEPMLTEEMKANKPALPQIFDFKPYDCPITGKPITDRGMHRENLAKHNCVEAKEFGSPTNGEIKNHAFAKKRGLKVSDKYMDQPELSKGLTNE